MTTRDEVTGQSHHVRADLVVVWLRERLVGVQRVVILLDANDPTAVEHEQHVVVAVDEPTVR